MKTYVLIVSQTFPAWHSKAGQQTGFVGKIVNALLNLKGDKKLHTIRKNYDLWAKRFKEIEAGEAMLSIRVWSGKPYRSEQITICNLTNMNEIGLQKLDFITHKASFIDDVLKFGEKIASNDGLSYEDWCEWFKDCNSDTKPMAIIHFTNFRY